MQLESCKIDELSFSQKSRKPLYEYENNCIGRQIYNENLEDCGSVELAQSRSQAKCVYRYWKVKAKGRSVTRHPEKYELNMVKYREELFTCVRPILQAYGMNKEGEPRLQEELTGQKQKQQKRTTTRE